MNANRVAASAAGSHKANVLKSLAESYGQNALEWVRYAGRYADGAGRVRYNAAMAAHFAHQLLGEGEA